MDEYLSFIALSAGVSMKVTGLFWLWDEPFLKSIEHMK